MCPIRFRIFFTLDQDGFHSLTDAGFPEGAGARDFLRQLLTNDVDRMAASSTT